MVKELKWNADSSRKRSAVCNVNSTTFTQPAQQTCLSSRAIVQSRQFRFDNQNFTPCQPIYFKSSRDSSILTLSWRKRKNFRATIFETQMNWNMFWRGSTTLKSLKAELSRHARYWSSSFCNTTQSLELVRAHLMAWEILRRFTSTTTNSKHSHPEFWIRLRLSFIFR